MKKIKLLMPVVGLSTIAATAIPLASCNKKPKVTTDITEADWKKAIDFLLCEDEEMPYWYSNTDDVAAEQTTDKYGDVVYNTWNDIIYQDGDYYAKTTNYKGEKSEMYYERSKMVGVWNYNAYMTADQQRVKAPQWNFYLTDKAIDSLFLALRSIYNSFADFALNTETKTFTWSGAASYGTYEFKSVLTNVQFDANKKISYFETTFEEFQDEKQVRLATMKLHFNYGKKAIEYPTWFDERIQKRNVKADETGVATPTNLSGSLGEEGTVINFTAPVGGENQIFVKSTKAGAADVAWLVHGIEETDPNKYEPGCAIVKNGNILVYGTDYKITPEPVTTGTFKGGNTIVFTKALKKGDVIDLWVKPLLHDTFKFSETYSFALQTK